MNHSMRASVSPWAPLCAGVLATFLLWGFCHLYSDTVPPLLARMDVSVGEVLKERGLRLERAGDRAAAARAYELALAGTFNGVEHRREAEERLGRIFLDAGRAPEAVRLLKSAASGPRGRAAARPVWVEAIFAAGEPGEAIRQLRAWAPSGGNEDRGEWSYCHALMWRWLIDTGSKDGKALEEAARKPTGRELVPMLAPGLIAAGRYDEARRLLLPYIAGGSGRRAAEGRRLWEELDSLEPCAVLTALQANGGKKGGGPASILGVFMRRAAPSIPRTVLIE